MTRVGMARLAQVRLLKLEHRQMVRSVRIVTVAAVFSHWRVLPQHRSPFFLMAEVTGFVERCLYEQIGSKTAVRVVATGTIHLAFAQRHVGGSQHARPLVSMTGEARLLGICVNRQLAFTFPRHHIMAFVAGHIGHFMCASLPVQGDLFLVALLADLVFLLRRDGFK